MDLINKYNDLPKLAKWKALLIEYGVDLTSDSLFLNYPGIENYKTKYRTTSPTVKDFKFIDTATDKSIIPSEIIISESNTQSLVKINYQKDSPIVLGVEDDRITLSEKENKNKISLTVFLVAKRKYTDIKIEDDPQKPPLEDFIQIIGLDRIGILFFSGCWHWNRERPCLFCDSNPKRKDFKTAMPTLNTLPDFKFDEDKWWDSYKLKYLSGVKTAFEYILKNEHIEPHRHLHIMSGCLPHSKKVWDIAFEISELINKIEPIANFDSYLNLSFTNDKNYLLKAKELGYKYLQFNLEVTGSQRFKEVCPGKASVTSYEEGLAILRQAVKIFGFGNVRSNFVLGAQPVAELLAGIKELAKMGVVADYSIFVPKRGTAWTNRPSPDMETIVNFTKNLAKIYKEYDFKSIYCGLSSRSNILYEILNY